MWTKIEKVIIPCNSKSDAVWKIPYSNKKCMDVSKQKVKKELTIQLTRNTKKCDLAKMVKSKKNKLLCVVNKEIGILLLKLFWPTVRKNCSSDREKLLKFEAEGREFAKIFEITRTIYSNSERSEQFLVTECFFNLFLEVSHI